MSNSCHPPRSPLDYPEFHTADVVLPYLEETERLWRSRMDYLPPESQEYGLQEIKLAKEFLQIGHSMGVEAVSNLYVDPQHLQRSYTFKPIVYETESLEELTICQNYETNRFGRVCNFMVLLKLCSTKIASGELIQERSSLPLILHAGRLVRNAEGCESTQKTRAQRYEFEMALRHTNIFQSLIFEQLCTRQENLGSYMETLKARAYATNTGTLKEPTRSFRYTAPGTPKGAALN